MGKITLFVMVFLLELFPMVTLIRWRMALKKNGAPDLGKAPMLARYTFAELPLLILIVFMAAAMARGL